MTRQGPGPTGSILGRQPELGRLQRALEQVGERGTAFLVTGEAGIGKSVLLSEVQRRAGELGVQILRTTGAASEAHLPYASLHRLLRPLLASNDASNAEQRAIVMSALGLNDQQAPEAFRTALAALDLLVDHAATKPLLVVAEDAHWLDRPTWDALTFIGRRLEDDPVVLLASSREGPDEQHVLATASGFERLQLGGLPDEEARRLLDTRSPDLAPAVRNRVLKEAAGNPLAIVELPIAVSQLTDEVAQRTWLPLTARLEQAFTDRMSGLPAVTRSLLLIAAVNDGDTIDEILAAGRHILSSEPGLDDLVPAIDAQLITVDGSALRFRHALVRSAVAEGASLPERHAVHQAFAEVLPAGTDRQVWHRAAATTGPDESVAAELEAAANRAAGRGAMVTAQAGFEDAARLSESAPKRVARLLKACEAAFELGRWDVLTRLLEDAATLPLNSFQRTRLAWWREILLTDSWSGANQVPAFVAIANEMRLNGDTDEAFKALEAISLRCWWSNPGPDLQALIRSTAELIDVPEDDSRLLTVLALAAPADCGTTVIERLSRVPLNNDPGVLQQLALAATAVGAFDLAARFLMASTFSLRAQGRLGNLAQALVSEAWTRFNLGRPDIGRSTAAEAERLSVETGQAMWAATAQAAGAALNARRGNFDAAEELASRAETALTAMGSHPLLALVELGRGVTALGAGRYTDAVDHLLRIFDPTDIAHHGNVRPWAIGDLVEAAVHAGRQDAVRPLVADLQPLVEITSSPVLRINMLYVDAQLAADEDAEDKFRAALAYDHTQWPFNWGRLQLAFGVWLRRQRRAAESRGPLRTAAETFDALGATPWLERARQELRASGDAWRQTDDRLVDQLTPQELQIAQLAASGLTNREIAGQLFLSHRTVSTHLYHVYPKLGVTSRAQLRDALADLYTEQGPSSAAS